MLNLFDPTTWPLWVFIPAIRYIIIPNLTGVREGSHFLVVPLYATLCIATVCDYASVGARITELVLAGLVLVTMLSLELWRVLKTLQRTRLIYDEAKHGRHILTR